MNYSDGLDVDDTWPAAADGSGQSLSKISSSSYGNDVINWKAANTTPGIVNE